MKTQANNTNPSDLQKAARYLRHREDELVRSYQNEPITEKPKVIFSVAAAYSAIGEK